MFEELDIFLSAVATDIQKERMANIMNNLQELNVEYHNPDIIDVILNGSEVTHEQQYDLIVDILKNVCFDVISEMGVTVADHAELTQLDKILSTLIELPKYGDVLPLLNMMEQELEDTQILVDLLGLVSDKSWEWFAPWIESCDTELMGLLTEIYEAQLEENGQVDVTVQRERLNAFRESVVSSTGLSLLQNGVVLGSPLKYVLELSEEELITLEDKPEKLTESLFSILLISDIPNSRLDEQFRLYIEEYVKDINYLQKALTRYKELREVV